MYAIDTAPMSDEFLECWAAACRHIDAQVDSGIRSWLRAHPYPPYLEHLSFRLGNQLFFIRVVDVDERVPGPGNPGGLLSIADRTGGHACYMPMQRQPGGAWRADRPGWGLVDARSGAPVDPVALVSDERIEMTRWEVHDMAVQVVRAHFESRGIEVSSWQGNPAVDPSIWIVGDAGRPEWVVVRAALYPEARLERPANWDAIAAGMGRHREAGRFAPVYLCSDAQPFAQEGEPAMPLWRGHGLRVRFTGPE